MKVITNVEIVNVDKDWMRRATFLTPETVGVFDSVTKEPVEVKVEHIRGRRFISPRKGEFVIGMSEEVQDLIGIPFKAFDNMEKMVEEYRLECNKYKKECKRLKNCFKMSFWERLKFLFRR